MHAHITINTSCCQMLKSNYHSPQKVTISPGSKFKLRAKKACLHCLLGIFRTRKAIYLFGISICLSPQFCERQWCVTAPCGRNESATSQWARPMTSHRAPEHTSNSLVGCFRKIENVTERISKKRNAGRPKLTKSCGGEGIVFEQRTL